MQRKNAIANIIPKTMKTGFIFISGISGLLSKLKPFSRNIFNMQKFQKC